MKLLFPAALLLCMDCVTNEDAVHLVGPISHGSVAYIEQRLTEIGGPADDRHPLLVTSEGGDVKSLEQLTVIARKRFSRIFVYKHCLSACASLITFAGVPVRVSDGAVIGFHGDPETTVLQLEKYGAQATFSCTYNDALPFIALRASQGLDSRIIAKETLDRLKFGPPHEKADIFGRPGCKGGTFEAERRMWFPTSAQIERIFGTHISGNLCNDSRECILNFARSRWKGEPLAIVVGDEFIAE